MRRAVVTLEGRGMEVVAGALAPEGGRDVPRARVKITSAPDRVTLAIDALDISALRTALNSYLRWTAVALRIKDEVKA